MSRRLECPKCGTMNKAGIVCECVERGADRDEANAKVEALERELIRLKAAHRNELATMTDRDLPESRRTFANFWKIQYIEARAQTASANKGIARLRRRLASAKARDASLEGDNRVIRAENDQLRNWGRLDHIASPETKP